MTTDRTIEDLLAAMVDTDGYARAIAYRDVITSGQAGVRVCDVRCGDIVMTLAQLYRHLITTDTAAAIARRGFWLHTPINVVLHDPDEGGHGPGMAAGR
jgi:hypothetical protein